MAEVTSQTPQRTRRHNSRRKRSTTDEGDADLSSAKKVVSESPKRRPRADGNIDDSIGHMDPSFLADHIAKRVKRSFRGFSTVELEDKYLPQKIFYNTSDFELPRKLDNLPVFLEQFSKGAGSLSESSEIPGSPHTLVIAASGLRAAEVTRFEIYPHQLSLDAEVSDQVSRKVPVTGFCCW